MLKVVEYKMICIWIYSGKKNDLFG